MREPRFYYIDRQVPDTLLLTLDKADIKKKNNNLTRKYIKATWPLLRPSARRWA